MLSIEREEFLDTIKKRDISRLKRFLEREPSLTTTKDRNGVSAILVAIYYGNKEAADLIAAKKPELDVFEAASLGHLDQVKSLITRNRSRVNSFTPDGLTPLALAAFLGHDEVVEFLLHQGADVNVTEHKLGFNALTGAVNEGHKKVIAQLLQHGANVNYRYESGSAAPILTATINGDVEIIKLLLAYGANVNTVGGDGKTPLKIALEKAQDEVVGILRKHGAS